MLGQLEQQAFWRPIATAPVPPRVILMHGRWRCLLQTKKGEVRSGYAAYAQSNPSTSSVPTYEVRWYGDEGRMRQGPRIDAVKWMPLPPPELEGT